MHFPRAAYAPHRSPYIVASPAPHRTRLPVARLRYVHRYARIDGLSSPARRRAPRAVVVILCYILEPRHLSPYACVAASGCMTVRSVPYVAIRSVAHHST
jgi:hypothetical protein